MDVAELPPILKFSAAAVRRKPGPESGGSGARAPGIGRRNGPKATGASIVTLLCFKTLSSADMQSLGAIEAQDRGTYGI